VLPETAVPAGLDGVHVMTIAGLPPRRLALVNTRDAYLSIADRAVRDAALRMMRERFGAGRSRRRRAPKSAGDVAKPPAKKLTVEPTVKPTAKRSPRTSPPRS